jgi:hypothetical protein
LSAATLVLGLVAGALADIGPMVESSPFLLTVQRQLGWYIRRRWLPFRRRLLKTSHLVQETLLTRQIPFVFMRGVSAANYYYLPQQRMYNDLDILVPQSCHREAEEVLLAAGFSIETKPCVAEAKRAYEGQIELRHQQTRVVVDLNWKLTANGQTGGWSPDMADVWGRVVDLGRGSYSLAPVDSLQELVRHVGHGHDFEASLIQCCADVAAMLRRESASLDWDRFCEAACACGYRRVLAFFTWFYERHYRDTQVPGLAEHMDGGNGIRWEWEKKCFARVVLIPQLRLRVSRPTLVNDLRRANLRMLAKFWSVDTFRGCVRLLRLIVWPTWEVMVLLQEHRLRRPVAVVLVRHYATFFMLARGILLGCLARIASAVHTLITYPIKYARHRVSWHHGAEH